MQMNTELNVQTGEQVPVSSEYFCNEHVLLWSCGDRNIFLYALLMWYKNTLWGWVDLSHGGFLYVSGMQPV
jgi:hypothetical protein